MVLARACGALTLMLAFRRAGSSRVTGLVAAGLFVLLLVGRLTLAERPFAGWSAPLGRHGRRGRVFACGHWRRRAGRMRPRGRSIEFDRALLYLLVSSLVGCRARPRAAVAAAALGGARDRVAARRRLRRGCCRRLLDGAGVTTPGSLPADLLERDRRVRALCGVLALHFTASEREPAAAACLRPRRCRCSRDVYFTFSRGGIAAARRARRLPRCSPTRAGWSPRCPPSGYRWRTRSIAPTGRTCSRATYYAGAGAQEQGQDLFVAMIGPPWRRPRCARSRCSSTGGWRGSRSPRACAAASTRPQRSSRLVALVVAAVAFDLPDRVDDAHGVRRSRDDLARRRATCASGSPTSTTTAASPSGGSALDAAHEQPGRQRAPAPTGSSGNRPTAPPKVVDGHSLCFEVRGELGWSASSCSLIALLDPLGVAASRLGGPGRHAYAAFLAAGVALLIHAKVDWDWEMPALFIWFFGAAGVVLAAPVGAPASRPGRAG